MNTQSVSKTILPRDPEMADFGGLAGPGGPEDPPKRWGGFPPTFREGVPGPRGPKSAISGSRAFLLFLYVFTSLSESIHVHATGGEVLLV